MQEWYPKIVELIAVPGFASPTQMTLRLQQGGVPAYASGGNIVVSSDFLRSHEKGEAIGCVIHEIVHIAQTSDWGRGRRGRVPGWVTEGVAGYIGWFLFEPESQGAVIRDPDKARYEASYRTNRQLFRLGGPHPGEGFTPQAQRHPEHRLPPCPLARVDR